MKNLIITLCFVFAFSGNLLAQSTSYTPFEWDVIRLGFVNPLGDDHLTGGPSIGGEIRFNLINEFSVGVGSEFVFYNAENIENLEKDEDATVAFSSYSYLVGDYYFSTTSSNRAFIGLGIGYSDIGDIELTLHDGSALELGESGANLLPRIGYELGHVRFLLNYNVGLKNELPNYLSFKVAFTLWGGYSG